MEPKKLDFIMRQLRSRSFATPKHHLIALRPFPGFPAMKIPVLHLATVVAGEEQLVHYGPALDYCSLHPQRSETWHRSVTKILGMAFDFQIQASVKPEHALSVGVAQHFVQCVQYGTITSDGPKHTDRLQLYWRAPSEKLGRTLLKSLKKFLDEVDVDFSTLDDPFSRFLAALQTKSVQGWSRGFSILSHLTQENDKPEKEPRKTSWDHWDALQDGIDGGAVYRFPSDLWLPLLNHGHLIDESQKYSLSRSDATGRAHASLLSLGLRQSTPLHLWVSDVSFSSDGLATVTLRHPEEFYERSKKMTRKAISKEMGLNPRKRLHGRFQAGWKNLKLETGLTAPTQWLPGSRELGSAILRDYILNVREPIMAKRRALGLPDHPFLLVSTADDPAKGQFIGDPYTRKAAIGSWKRAMGRLQVLYPDRDLRVRKDLGTTMHGVRHLMGFTCNEAGLSLSDTADVLHHRSPLSALIYIKRTSKEISDTLDHASKGGKQNTRTASKDHDSLRILRALSVGKNRK